MTSPALRRRALNSLRALAGVGRYKLGESATAPIRFGSGQPGGRALGEAAVGPAAHEVEVQRVDAGVVDADYRRAAV